MTDRVTEPGAPRAVVALFEGRDEAERAIRDLHEAGIPRDAIGVVLRERDEEGRLLEATGSGAAEGAATGAATGGVLGGLLGLLVGVGALALPGVGPVVAGGVLASVLGTAAGTAVAGAGIGAATGGLLGALAGMGIPNDEAERFERGVQEGGVLLVVHPEGRSADVRDLLERNGGDVGATGRGGRR
jgi:uncharacterized membrane protein